MQGWLGVVGGRGDARMVREWLGVLRDGGKKRCEDGWGMVGWGWQGWMG